MGAVNEWVVGGGWSRRLSLGAECDQIGRARQRRGCAGQQGGERLGGKADGLVDGAQGEVSSLLGQRGADMSGGMGGRRGESLGGRPNVVCARHLGQRREKISRKKIEKGLQGAALVGGFWALMRRKLAARSPTGPNTNRVFIPRSIHRCGSGCGATRGLSRIRRSRVLQRG